MGWHLYTPIAEQSINIFLLLGLGGSVGFLAGLCGVGGGFLMTPLLTMIGIPATIAAASDSNQVVASAASGTYAHARKGCVDFKMGLILFAGGLLGSTVGVRLVGYLRAEGDVDFFIRILYVVLLGVVGGVMMIEGVASVRRARDAHTPSPHPTKPTAYDRLIQAFPGGIHFDKSGITLSPVLPLLVGFLVGLLAAIMGVGGGFIMLPAMCYLLRMPMRVVVGTNLFQELLVSANITIQQAAENQTVDLTLALVLLIGSAVGAQLGTGLGHRMHAETLKIVFAALVLMIMVYIFLQMVLPPEFMVSMKGDQ